MMQRTKKKFPPNKNVTNLFMFFKRKKREWKKILFLVPYFCPIFCVRNSVPFQFCCSIPLNIYNEQKSYWILVWLIKCGAQWHTTVLLEIANTTVRLSVFSPFCNFCIFSIDVVVAVGLGNSHAFFFPLFASSFSSVCIYVCGWEFFMPHSHQQYNTQFTQFFPSPFNRSTFYSMFTILEHLACTGAYMSNMAKL